MSHKHSESRSFTPFKAVPFSPEKCQRFHFVHPFTCMVAGMTGSGKTVWVQSLLQQSQNVMEPPPERIIWCYSQWQPAYSKLLNTVPNIEFVKGIPENLEQDSYFNDNKRNLIVIDDQMIELKQYEEAVQRPFGYFFVDLKTTTQDNCRLRTNVLPSEEKFDKGGVESNISSSRT